MFVDFPSAKPHLPASQMMQAHELHNDLEALKLEIQLLDDTPEETRVYLVKVVNSIEKILDSPDEQEHRSLRDAVLEIVESYQIEHPKLASLIDDITTKLMSIGV